MVMMKTAVVVVMMMMMILGKLFQVAGTTIFLLMLLLLMVVMMVSGRVFQAASTSIFLLMLLLMAKGYTITRGRMTQMSTVRLTVFFCLYVIVNVTLFIWEGMVSVWH